MARVIRIPSFRSLVCGFFLTALVSLAPILSQPIHAASLQPMHVLKPLSNPAPLSTSIQCGATRQPPSAFHVSQSGGYTGRDRNGKQCPPSFSYARTPTKVTATWAYDEAMTDFGSLIRPEAFIPYINATAVVDYTVYDCNGSAIAQSRGFNQKPVNDWQLLPLQNMSGAGMGGFGGGCLGKVVLSSNMVHQEDMAEDALGFINVG